MGQRECQGKVLFRLVCRIAEHHALVSGTLPVNAEGDVGALGMECDDYPGFVGEEVFIPGVADCGNGLSDDCLVIHIGLGSDLTHHMDELGAACGLDCGS